MRKIDLEKRLQWDDWDEAWKPMVDDSVGFSITQYRKDGKRYVHPCTPLDKNMDIDDVKKFLGEKGCALYEIDQPTTEVIARITLDGARWERTLKRRQEIELVRTSNKEKLLEEARQLFEMGTHLKKDVLYDFLGRGLRPLLPDEKVDMSQVVITDQGRMVPIINDDDPKPDIVRIAE